MSSNDQHQHMNPHFSAMPESILSTVFHGGMIAPPSFAFPHLVSSSSSSPASSPTFQPKSVVSVSSVSTTKKSQTSGSKKASSSSKSDNGGKRKRTPKAADAPRRPLSAYNLFFKRERSLILASLNNDKAGDSSPDSSDTESNDTKKQQPVFVGGSYSGMLSTPQGQTVVQPVDGPRPRQLKRSHRRTHGKISFADMAKRISAKWKALDEESRRPFVEQAKDEKEQYLREVAKYKARKAQEAQAKEQQQGTTMSAGQDSCEVEPSTGPTTSTVVKTSPTTPLEDNEELGPKTKKARATENKQVTSTKPAATTSAKNIMPKRPSSLDALDDQMEHFLCNMEPTAVSPGSSDDEEGPVATSSEQDPFHIDIEEVDAHDLLGILDAAIVREGDMALPMTDTTGTTNTKSMPPKKAIALRRLSLLLMMGEEVTTKNDNPDSLGSTPNAAPTTTDETASLNMTMSMPGMPAIPPGVDTLRFMEGYLHQQQLQIARNNEILRKARMTAMMGNTNAGVRATAAAKNIKAKIDISVTPV